MPDKFFNALQVFTFIPLVGEAFPPTGFLVFPLMILCTATVLLLLSIAFFFRIGIGSDLTDVDVRALTQCAVGFAASGVLMLVLGEAILYLLAVAVAALLLWVLWKAARGILIGLRRL